MKAVVLGGSGALGSESWLLWLKGLQAALVHINLLAHFSVAIAC